MKLSKIGIAARGMAMGIAEIIPGVSGGTIAFITGIYADLLDAISAVDGSFFKNILKGRFGEALEQINIRFLISLMSGMAIGLLIGIFGISYMLEHYPEVIWALFFGLILASIPYMLFQLKKRRASSIFIFTIGAFVAYWITTLVPAEGSQSLIYIFFGGMIAICALVLPGISGSFVLLLLGIYGYVIPTLKSFIQSPQLSELFVILAFAAGAITGLLSFSKLISAAFHKYHDATIALLSGFMLGSLNKIWPWRNIDTVLDKRTGQLTEIGNVDLSELEEHYKIITEVNALPGNYAGDARILWVILAFLLGILIVWLLSRIQKRVYN